MNVPAYASTRSSKSKTASIVLIAVLMAGPGLSADAAAQSTDSQPASANATPVASSDSNGHQPTRQLIKPGDRTCLQQTGRLIPAKKGHCLPVPGHSYSGEELRNTGAIDNAHALQMLDPSITLGH